jgi:hypothetical protein
LIPPEAPLQSIPPGWIDSLIISDFPPLFDDFRMKRWHLLWRGSDGFGAEDFHQRCDRHANTVTLIMNERKKEEEKPEEEQKREEEKRKEEKKRNQIRKRSEHFFSAFSARKRRKMKNRL